MLIILYVLDSLRPDFLSCYGCNENTSPNIDKIAKDGVIFKRAYAQSTWTRPSGASILSSLYPSCHGVMTVKDVLSSSVPFLPEQLKKLGFKTVAISSMGNISPAFGFGRDFDHFVELYKERSVMTKRKVLQTKKVGWQDYFDTEIVAIPTSEEINEYLFPFLKKYGHKKLFIFIWSLDTHGPFFHRDLKMVKYSPPSEELLWNNKASLKSEKLKDRIKTIYKDMIYYNDYHIGILVEKLKELALYDESFFIITSDHGESFGEHGIFGHAGVPYEEQIRVPLIMKFPHQEFRGSSVDSLTQHIDIYPTILEYLRSPVSNFVQGKSLLPIIRREKASINSYIFNETGLRESSPRYFCLRTEKYKYIKSMFRLKG
ncbi:MAG TPA: hypothetical protein ENF30_02405, partial [Candidatus Desulfofervidus auxilii]|nr:hypothetical protein [Candidatus Desulfofervidus auxilii]